ncbi:hypothetical protein B9Z19DRAFT_1119963 [Tuber borchii]|uniref:DUF7881 domain-containing protein n=1 Tax=Tuber borchii TaxID=42251 RepID=A0A2T7A5G8_TUBBO|nr:hypothetical protein B9Z19DRAFT_1119963 [Tuber borchii]
MLSCALGRNVHVYSVRYTNTVLGSLFATNGVTNTNLYSMVEIAFIFDNGYTLCGESGTTVQWDDHPLPEDRYPMNTAGSLRVKNRPILVRTGSLGARLLRKNFVWRCVNVILSVITGQPALNAVYAVYRREGYRSDYSAFTHSVPKLPVRPSFH